MDEEAVVAQKEEAPQELTQVPSALPQSMWLDKSTMGTLFKSAQMLASSDLVPEGVYRGKPGNCLIALEMAIRLNMSPLHVMQNLYIVKGKPSWSGQFCIAAANGSGIFSPLEFIQLTDEAGNLKGYFARAKRISDGKICDGPPVTWDMVKAEGWYDKSGSKWKTMPELMFHYRAAAFFVRTHCPHVLCGLQTTEEVQDVRGYEDEKKTTVITF